MVPGFEIRFGLFVGRQAWQQIGTAAQVEYSRDELARGLAYWASTYRPVPGNLDDPGKQKGRLGAGLNDLSGVTSAVESLHLEPARNGIFRERPHCMCGADQPMR